jgi:cytochrome c oxidase cbb3-type subunit 3
MSHDDNKEFDGIKQADNALPIWWKQFLVASIVIAIVYSIYFHGFSTWKGNENYQLEKQAKELKYPKKDLAVNEFGTNPLRGDSQSIENGQKVFTGYCSACHGPQGMGLVGPSLMDAEWIHGSTDSQIYHVIMKGVVASQTKLNRGPMPAHEVSLGSEKVYQVMAWIAQNNSSLKDK